MDVGTTSVLLLVARQQGGQLQAVEEACVITRLGQGVDRCGRLAPEARARTLAALRQMGQRLDALGVRRRWAVGTSVLRDARDAASFAGQAEGVLGCPLVVVDGAEEAALVLAGVQGALGPQPAGSLICDVGGGSTELIRCAGQGQVPDLLSLDLGSVRLTERHLSADPPDAAQVGQLRREVRRALAELPAPFARPQRLVGVAGTVTTLAAIHLGLPRYDTAQVNGLELTLPDVERMVERLCALPLHRRAALAGLEPARADIIVAGALLVQALLQSLALPGLQVCDRGLRWGLLWRQLPG